MIMTDFDFELTIFDAMSELKNDTVSKLLTYETGSSLTTRAKEAKKKTVGGMWSKISQYTVSFVGVLGLAPKGVLDHAK